MDNSDKINHSDMLNNDHTKITQSRFLKDIESFKKNSHQIKCFQIKLDSRTKRLLNNDRRIMNEDIEVKTNKLKSIIDES